MCKEKETLFNNSSPPCHPGTILESITYINNVCNICTLIHCLRSDQSIRVHTVSLLRFWTLIVLDPCCQWEGQRALGIHQKHLNFCYEDEQRSYRFGTTWEWVINDRIFIFGWIHHSPGVWLTSDLTNHIAEKWWVLTCFHSWNKIPSDVYSCLFRVITSKEEEMISSLAAWTDMLQRSVTTH